MNLFSLEMFRETDGSNWAAESFNKSQKWVFLTEYRTSSGASATKYTFKSVFRRKLCSPHEILYAKVIKQTRKKMEKEFESGNEQKLSYYAIKSELCTILM